MPFCTSFEVRRLLSRLPRLGSGYDLRYFDLDVLLRRQKVEISTKHVSALSAANLETEVRLSAAQPPGVKRHESTLTFASTDVGQEMWFCGNT